MSKLQIKEPIDIFLVTYKRLHLLKKTIKSIYNNTQYPYRLWVANNDKDDVDTINYLKQAKGWGYLHDFITLDENLGQANGYKESYKYAEKQLKGNISKYIVQTQDDLIPPELEPCWLERLLHLIAKNKDHGAICLRIERTRRRDIDESLELIPSDTACPAVFRITSKEMIETIGHFSRPHWESHTFSDKVRSTGKKLAMATKIYASHIGFIDNKGFADGFTSYHTYSKERVTQGKDQPYADIDTKTNIPVKINTPRDASEHAKRMEYWEYWGVDRSKVDKQVADMNILVEFAEKGRGIEVGCGRSKVHENAIGVDVFPFKAASILADAQDLWMFKDGELDFVVSCHSLEHFPDTKRTLRERKRVLKPGGVIAVVVPDGEKRPESIRGCHKVALTKKVLRFMFKYDLRMGVTREESVVGKKVGKESILVAAVKRK